MISPGGSGDPFESVIYGCGCTLLGNWARASDLFNQREM